MGLGLALKWYQRDWYLAQGITHVRWTYDPLRVANAALNIHRLGGQAQTYFPDYYGPMAGINKGVASDRLLVDWHLDTPRVAACAAGKQPLLACAALRLPVPADFGHMIEVDLPAAGAARLLLRTTMQAAFAGGLMVQDFDPAGPEYLLMQS